MHDNNDRCCGKCAVSPTRVILIFATKYHQSNIGCYMKQQQTPCLAHNGCLRHPRYPSPPYRAGFAAHLDQRQSDGEYRAAAVRSIVGNGSAAVKFGDQPHDV
jgi:hypothetical protein